MASERQPSTIFEGCGDVGNCKVYHDADCYSLFGVLTVLPSIQGGTRVEWDLNERLKKRQKGVYRYTLQVSFTGVQDETAWRDVVTEDDTYYLVDPRQRVYGSQQYTYYRVKLESPESGFMAYSAPAHCFGALTCEQWNYWNACLQNEKLHLSQGGVPGWLYKHKLSYAKKCPACASFQTDEPTQPFCEVCRGTGYETGYYDPVCCYMNLTPSQYGQKTDMETQGSVHDTTKQAECLCDPMPVSYDIWINAKNDHRYFIHEVTATVAPYDVPLKLGIAMRKIAFSNPLYQLLRRPSTLPSYLT